MAALRRVKGGRRDVKKVIVRRNIVQSIVTNNETHTPPRDSNRAQRTAAVEAVRQLCSCIFSRLSAEAVSHA